MSNRTSTSARILAAAALAAAFVLAIVVIGGAVGGGDSNGSEVKGHGAQRSPRTAEPEPEVPATYEIQSGDTLIAIAHRTRVPVARIEALNPQVDPQILIVGETLKLRP